jgi:hypothetical protein
MGNIRRWFHANERNRSIDRSIDLMGERNGKSVHASPSEIASGSFHGEGDARESERDRGGYVSRTVIPPCTARVDPESAEKRGK